VVTFVRFDVWAFCGHNEWAVFEENRPVPKWCQMSLLYDGCLLLKQVCNLLFVRHNQEIGSTTHTLGART
jgi:hypothetical protein